MYPVITGQYDAEFIGLRDYMLATLAEILSAKLPDNAGEDSFSFVSLLKGDDKPTRQHAVSCAAAGTA